VPRLCFLAIAATGFAASVAQILVLRELLVLFYGNEISTGLILAAWLLWTAVGSGVCGRFVRRMPSPFSYLPLPVTLLSLLLPLTLLWIRAAGMVWSISRGELVSLGVMFGISMASICLFCLVSGFLFALTWSAYIETAKRGQARPIGAYLGEAVGSALGGLVFYFVLLPGASAFSSALIVSMVLLGVAAVLLFHSRRWGAVGPWAVALVFASLALFFSPQLDLLSRHWQWGPGLVGVKDTPFQNLALLKNENQYTLFGNGLWLFSEPDPQTAEYAVHLALLEHRHPKEVLFVGGGLGGLITEALKHPSIKSLEDVEPDPGILRLAEKWLPASITGPLNDKRVHLLHMDAGAFVRTTSRTYDVVLLNMGDPLNAETNRFYTVEFFRRVSRLLKPRGIFSLGVSASPDIIGANQARFLRSIYVTLRSVFPHVLAIPGSTVRFIAASRPEDLTADPKELVERIAARNLQPRLKYVREYYLFDYMNPMRLDYLSAILKEGGGTAINRDFAPTCYFNSLIVWGEQIQPVVAKALVRLLHISPIWFWGGLLGLILGIAGVFRLAGPAGGAAISLCVAVVGGGQMVLEIALLLAFQILVGFVYTELALVISFFMAGTALGALGASRISDRTDRPLRWLVAVQGLFSLYLVGILALFLILHGAMETAPRYMPPKAAIFSLGALMAGLMGGLHFTFAVKSRSSLKRLPAEIGAGLYGLDLIGAAAGALVAVLFFIPVYGLLTAVAAAALLCLGSMIPLLMQAPPAG
jgi:spermidine synthase